MTAPIKDAVQIKDAVKAHWVYRAPASLRPYLQLARYDRPVGYWLLALPGWIGLAFASLSRGLESSDLKWAALILIGAIAMRGAACTYNDIVDRDLDAQVDRTALRPLPAGTVTVKQAWVWTFVQCFAGLAVLLCLPSLAQIISLCSIPLVAAYPFMKRITWWPQVWLGLTFNWAVLVAFAAKTGTISPAVLVLYAGLMFWTIGYDTIYACQDIEDDMKIGVKSTARKFGSHVALGVGLCYAICILLVSLSVQASGTFAQMSCGPFIFDKWDWGSAPNISFKILFFGWVFPIIGWVFIPFVSLLVWQIVSFCLHEDVRNNLKLFKSNFWVGLCLALSLCLMTWTNSHTGAHSDEAPCRASYPSDIEFETYRKRFTPL